MASASVELPEDILMLIFAGLEVPDLVRAGSVCSSWHGAYNSILNLGRCKQQTPCLLYTNRSYGASAAGLYSLTEKKQYRLALPDPPIRSRYIIGTAHGWIITIDNLSELDLVNPITGEQITLPSITTIYGLVTPMYDKNGTLKEYLSYPVLPGRRDPPYIFGLSELRNYFFQKAFLSSDPSTESYVVVIIHNTARQLSFARAGDDCWTRLSLDDFFADCLFKDKLLYAVTERGGIHVFDLSGPAVEKKVVLENVRDSCCEGDKMYIVEAPSGDLLQIWRLLGDKIPLSELDPSEKDDEFPLPKIFRESREPHSYPYFTTTYKLHKVDLVGKKLVEITCLDGNVLFFGLSESLCLCAKEYPQLMANHIYFTDDDVYMIFAGKNESRNMGVVDLDTNMREKIVYPRIWSNWPSPLWIMPNPRKMRLCPGETM